VSRADELTPTSYAILGLLALRDWSTYELAQQMQRSMRLWWPRAESRVYEEPKRLVRLELARTRDEGVGARPRTVYGITDHGRDTLRDWLSDPAGIFRLEFEAMVKVFFADQGTKSQLVANIDRIRGAALADLQRDQSFVEQYLTTGGPFPERLHIIGLVTDLYARLLHATVEWADDASAEVAAWRSTRAAPDPTARLRARHVGDQPVPGDAPGR
jgi:PadR family transcriptional regulator, regulatory protein AphA